MIVLASLKVAAKVFRPISVFQCTFHPYILYKVKKQNEGKYKKQLFACLLEPKTAELISSVPFLYQITAKQTRCLSFF